jgi:hypothetical protein
VVAATGRTAPPFDAWDARSALAYLWSRRAHPQRDGRPARVTWAAFPRPIDRRFVQANRSGGMSKAARSCVTLAALSLALVTLLEPRGSLYHSLELVCARSSPSCVGSCFPEIGEVEPSCIAGFKESDFAVSYPAVDGGFRFAGDLHGFVKLHPVV